LALRVFTAEFGMGSGVGPLAMATRPARPAPPFVPSGNRGGGLSCEDEGSVFLGEATGPPPLFLPEAGLGGAAGFAAVRGRRFGAWRASAGIKLIRAISTGQLRGLLRFHLRPIDVVVFHGSWARPGFEEGFPLRCVQRLSRPHLATRRCGWRHNRYTRGASLPVLSYWGERLASLEHPRQIGTELSHDVLNPAHVPL
jgi:hypothetical protein